MGRTTVITPEIAQQLLALSKAGKSRREMARATGISIGSVNRYIESLPASAAPLLVGSQEIIAQAGSSLWDTRTSLDANYQRVLALVQKLESGIIETGGEFSSSTPIAVHVAALKELREHIRTSMGLMKLLIDVDETRHFQVSVLEAIGEADEPTKQRIIAKLKERKALGFALF